MTSTLKPHRYKFLIAVVCLSAVLVEGTGLAQQVRLSRPARPRLIHGNLTAGPGAFVNRPVDTTDELIQVLETHPEVRKRYAKHFGVSEKRVVEFVKNALKVSRIQQPRIVDNYYVSKAGVIKFHRERMGVGTKVWATRSGLPVLKWICANPLTKQLPLAPSGLVLSQTPIRSVRIAELTPESPLPRMEALNTEVAIPDVPVPAALEVPAEAISTSTELARAPIALSGVGGNLPVVGGGGVGSFPLGKLGTTGLGLTPFLLPLVTSGGVSTVPGTTTTIVVPEPTSCALLLASLPLLIGVCRRRNA